MSSNPFNLDARWGARQADAQTCAERFAAMLSGLAPLHPAFARWCKQGYSRSAANHPFCKMPPDVEELVKIFRRHPFQRGVPQQGFSLSFWNGREGPHGMSVSVHAGDGYDKQIFPNDVAFHLHSSQPENADFITVAVLRPALLALAAAWDPDWAEVSTWAYFERWKRAEPWDDQERKHPRDDGYIPSIRAGWMTYLCPDYARRITRPAGIEVEPVTGGGALFIATCEVFTPGNPAHDAGADAIQNALLPLQNLPAEALGK